MRDNLASILRLLLVTDDRFLGGPDPVSRIRAAIAGGVTAVQLRLKQAGDREFLALAHRFRSELPVPLFINDRMDIALATGAHGVHLGPDDLAPELARRHAPAGFIIGASVGIASEIPRAQLADYWGIGPFRATSTKADAGDALGVLGVQAILAQAGGRPAVAIGGVLPEDAAALMAIGVAGVAVVSGILGAPDPEVAARSYREGFLRS